MKKPMNCLFSPRCLALAFLLCAATQASGQTFDVDRPPGANFDKAQFRLWLPETTESIKAVLVLVPGSNGDGRDQVDLPLWRALASELDLALVGLHFTDKPHEAMFIEHYIDVRRGSGDAFLSALTELAQLSGHLEIGNAPLLLWGMSAGGEFNYEFALWRPERVAAFVVNKGGIYYSALAPDAAWSVPGLFFIGDEDLAFRNDILRGIFSVNRRAGALWALIEQAGVGHAVSGSDLIAASFYREVLKSRLDPTGASHGMRELDIDDGYFCDPGTLRCIPAVGAETPREPISWLPTEVSAQAWRTAQTPPSP